MEKQMHMHSTPVRDALFRIQSEYIEMPDLKLTARQVQRLWHLSHDVCETALAALLGSGFLVRAASGAYVRPGVMRVGGEPGEPLLRAS